MRPATTEWLAPPYGEGFWWPSVLNAGLKMSPVFRPWYWKDRIAPAAYVEGTRDSVASTQLGFRQLADGIYVVQHAENEYAFVDTGTAHIPCQAVAVGGNIDVDCSTDVAGTLIVRENNWTGWSANLDGQDKIMDDGPWLSAAAPAGQHHYEFRYRPWDAWLGMALSLLGAGLTIALWIRSPDNRSNSRPHYQSEG
jgi:hypothetical protein